MTRKFFKRLSSFKVDYEKENRRTLKRYQSSYRDSGATFLRDKDTIMSLLRDTLQGDDVRGQTNPSYLLSLHISGAGPITVCLTS